MKQTENTNLPCLDGLSNAELVALIDKANAIIRENPFRDMEQVAVTFTMYRIDEKTVKVPGDYLEILESGEIVLDSTRATDVDSFGFIPLNSIRIAPNSPMWAEDAIATAKNYK